jgi:hypothetical protein
MFRYWNGRVDHNPQRGGHQVYSRWIFRIHARKSGLCIGNTIYSGYENLRTELVYDLQLPRKLIAFDTGSIGSEIEWNGRRWLSLGGKLFWQKDWINLLKIFVVFFSEFVDSNAMLWIYMVSSSSPAAWLLNFLLVILCFLPDLLMLMAESHVIHDDMAYRAVRHLFQHLMISWNAATQFNFFLLRVTCFFLRNMNFSNSLIEMRVIFEFFRFYLHISWL